jgi:hypothetical protein
MHDQQLVLTPIGYVASALLDPADAPKQGDEGAPDAWLILDARSSKETVASMDSAIDRDIWSSRLTHVTTTASRCHHPLR